MASEKISRPDITHRRFTVEDLKKCPFELLQYLGFAKDFEDCGGQLETDTYNVITIKLSESGETYHLYHGFSGDNPIGVLTLASAHDILALLGEHSEVMKESSDATQILLWYKTLTQDSCVYDSEIFY